VPPVRDAGEESVPAISRLAPKLTPLGLVLATLALAGCETVSQSAYPRVAVLEEDTQGTSKVNIASLSDVISRNPNDPGAYNTRGAAYARVGRYGDAIADFNKAVQLDPNNAPAYTNRALALRQTGKNEQALQDFTRAIQADPNYGPAYIGRGNLLRVQGQYQQALDDLTVAIRLTPESAEALHARGLLNQRQGLHQRAMAADPNNATGKQGLARLQGGSSFF
jgi:tetratricopeptide (TPR) repeat protein